MVEFAYHLREPETPTSSVVFASPHSGRNYPGWFLKRSILSDLAVRSSEDAFVDDLFAAAPEMGAPLLTATVPRAVLDLNRGADELDPALIAGIRSVGHNPRVASGLGVIPRVVSNGRAIYSGKLTEVEVKRRIEAYWMPYHRCLEGLMKKAQSYFGQAVLIDCHSMPREALNGVSRTGFARPDIVLGDRFGASASSEVIDMVEAAFASAGLRVSRNAPFAGAYITQHYGRPSRGRHVIQVEIDRSLYMDERYVEPNHNFETLKSQLERVMGHIIADLPGAMPLAAE